MKGRGWRGGEGMERRGRGRKGEGRGKGDEEEVEYVKPVLCSH